MATEPLRWIAEAKVALRIDREYPLAETAQAYRDMEAGLTTGKLLLKM